MRDRSRSTATDRSVVYSTPTYRLPADVETGLFVSSTTLTTFSSLVAWKCGQRRVMDTFCRHATSVRDLSQQVKNMLDALMVEHE